jgi:hypothetical protein
MPLLRTLQQPREILDAVPKLDEAHRDLVEIRKLRLRHQLDCDDP